MCELFLLQSRRGTFPTCGVICVTDELPPGSGVTHPARAGHVVLSLFSLLSSQRALWFFLFSLYFLCFNIQRLVLPKFKQAVRMYEVTASMQLVVFDSHSKPVTFREEQTLLLQHYRASIKSNFLQLYPNFDSSV